MKLKVKKLHPDAILPVYATPGAACFDIHALTVNDMHQIGSHADFGEPVLCTTGLAFEIPAGHVMLVFSRSGHGFKHGVRLANCVGVIDSDFRGELMVKLTQDFITDKCLDQLCTFIKPGERIAQATIVPIPQVELELVDELTSTERGTGGLGSTGA